ncbi:MAG: twin-arginine translocation signal domain-containing protein [Gemmataceae bacterium]|nr:twin-arginine translocation signal domain-containing protein [Gemmataceae bacterium]
MFPLDRRQLLQGLAGAGALAALPASAQAAEPARRLGSLRTAQPNRILTRAGRYGGIRPNEKKYMADLPVDAPNEATLIGAQTVSPFNGSGDWICTRPEHWLFEGTGMRKGERIPGLVGWEFHGEPAKIPGLVVAEGPTWTGSDRQSHYTATIYPGPKGSHVFNASTIFWAQGLAAPPGHMPPWSHNGRPHGPDPRVQRITRNVLERFRKG